MLDGRSGFQIFSKGDFHTTLGLVEAATGFWVQVALLGGRGPNIGVLPFVGVVVGDADAIAVGPCVAVFNARRGWIAEANDERAGFAAAGATYIVPDDSSLGYRG